MIKMCNQNNTTMKNETILNQLKGCLKNECSHAKPQETEIQKQEIKIEPAADNAMLKFQFINLDQIFAN